MEFSGEVNVALIPPMESVSRESDKDSVASEGEEEATAEQLFEHLPRRVLRSHAKMRHIAQAEDSEEAESASSTGGGRKWRGKPIRWGYKLWAAADPTDWTMNVEPYTADPALEFPMHRSDKEATSSWAFSTTSEPRKAPKWCSTHPTSLLQELTRRKIKGTGTLREDRVKKEMGLPAQG